MTQIYAPASGIVSKLNIEKGERVLGTSQMQGTEMLRIANLQRMEVRVDVNENDIIRVSMGDTAIIDVDSYSYDGKKFKGIVTSIANTAKPTISADAVTEFEVRIRILESSFRELAKEKKMKSPFRPGMTASVDIITDRKGGILTVPLSAVTTRTEEKGKGKKEGGEPRKVANKEGEVKKDENKKEEAKEVVFVHNKGVVKMVVVKTGISDLSNIEILSGLKEGDEIVSGPFIAVSKRLKDGENVVKKKEGGADGKEKPEGESN